MAKFKINDESIVDFGSTDPSNWRNLPDPENENEEDSEDDGDVPCPQFVKDILGFDPDDL